MNNEWAFLPMRESNDVLDDPDELRARLAEDSYLLLRDVLDGERLTALRARFCEILAGAGMIRGGGQLLQAVSIAEPVREGDDEFFAVYDEIQRLEPFHAAAHDPALTEIMRRVLGDSAFPHPLKIARLSFPGHYEVSTPPHQDYPNNQGTEDLTASWIPLGDIPVELGGLAVLRGSSRHGVLPLARHLGPGNRCAVVPEEMLETCRWVTTDFRLGDVLLFPSTTVHASLHNASEVNLRLSIDFRWQLEGEALTPVCLEPHFQRLGWEDVYAGWESTEHQWYWRDLDYEVVPFRELDLVGGPDDEDEAMRAAVRYDRRKRRRHERKLRRLARDDAERDGATPSSP